jgi:peptide/nickel transport system substrate-binding protein
MYLKSKLGLYPDFLVGITSVEAPDPQTVIIKTSNPKANMLQSTAPILPKHIWEKVKLEDLKTWPNEQPIGTGAFKFTEWKKGEYLKLEANKDYFQGSPKIDGLVFSLYANNDTLVQSLKVGELDVALGFDRSQVKLLKQEKDISVISASGNSFKQLALNTWQDAASKGNPLLKNKEIRHAIELALDKQKIIDVAYSGQGAAGSTLIPPFFQTWHYEPTKDEFRAYDAEKAKAVLDAAGYKDSNGDEIREDAKGTPLSFRLYLRAKAPEQVKAGQLISSMLKNIGIETTIETIDDGLLTDRIYDKANFDMFIWGWGVDVDPTTIFRALTTEQIGNIGDVFYSNPDYDKKVVEQSTILNEKERQQKVWDLQKILYDDLPYIILTYDNTIQAVKTDKWEGWKPVKGAYFFTLNNSNYLNVAPKKTESESTGQSGEVKQDGTEAADSKSSVLLWVIGVIAVLGIVVVIRSRRKKGIDDF